MSKIKLGILGAGHLGKIHIRLAQELQDEFEIVGFHDPNPDRAAEVEQKFGIHHYHDLNQLIDLCEAIDIVTTTLSHFECAMLSLRSSKHVFIEKPITNTIDEAKKLIVLAHEAHVKVQIGHVERFNPAFIAAQPYFDQVMFVETHRLAEFNPRGTDVSVVTDLMIHDIDIILSLVKANLRKVSASGVAVLSDSPDICNARLEFDNGCVANLTASRISLKNMRKSRFFQKNAYITVDFLEKKTEIVRMQDPDPKDSFALIISPGNGKADRQIIFEKPKIESLNSIKEELSSFAHCIKTGGKPAVTVDDGFAALSIASQIVDQLNFTNSIFAS